MSFGYPIKYQLKTHWKLVVFDFQQTQTPGDVEFNVDGFRIKFPMR